MKTGRKRIIVWLALALAVALLACGIAALVLFTGRTAQSQSLYLTMDDGVQIAVDVWLPADRAPGAKLPAILRATRYWRSYELGPIGRLLALSGNELLAEGENWAGAGYALVVVDVRGSGASFGQWSIVWSEQEIADLGQVVDWIVAQPWSNGRVGAYGVSYDGNTAEMLAALNHPAVRAVAPQYDDFDVQSHLVLPGGVYNRWFVAEWDEFTRRLDANDACGIAAIAEVECKQFLYVVKGIKPVDADADGSQLAAAVASRKPIDLAQIGQSIEYRDDRWGTTDWTLGDVSPYRSRAAIEASGVPIYVWVSWLDSASVEGAISRYLTFGNPQKVIIGPWAHGGGSHVDPFLPADTPTDPSKQEQFQMLVAFFDAYLKEDGIATQPEFGVTYYTLGEGAWKSTQTWPPAGFEPQRWYFGPQGSLALEPPAVETGADEYRVDWTATTGASTRWHTGLAMADVVYPDRAAEDKKLLTYTSPPLENDVEITGSPVVTLYVASTERDGAFHVYLEDVAPDGRVTYITEGMLRAIHRTVSDREPPYQVLGAYHSFERADAAPLVPGEVAEMRFNLFATSVLIKQGHRIRIAVSGYDGSIFERYPVHGTPVLTVKRNSAHPSHVELPILVRD